MKIKNNEVENKAGIIEAENKIIDMTSRIKDLNAAITKKKGELQIHYNEWRQARTQNALAEISDEEVEAKKIKYFALKEEVENLISELDPLSSALKVLKERHEAALNIAAQKHRESSIERLKEIRETEKDNLTRALDNLSEICSLEIALYEGVTFDLILKKDYYKYQFRTAIDTLRFLIPPEFDLAECKRVLHL